jgi:hypothetical protein
VAHRTALGEIAESETAGPAVLKRQWLAADCLFLNGPQDLHAWHTPAKLISSKKLSSAAQHAIRDYTATKKILALRVLAKGVEAIVRYAEGMRDFRRSRTWHS